MDPFTLCNETTLLVGAFGLTWFELLMHGQPYFENLEKFQNP
jgi:hypothetical protein